MVLEVIALLCLGIAGFLLAPWVGFAVCGLALLAVSRTRAQRPGGDSS